MQPSGWAGYPRWGVYYGTLEVLSDTGSVITFAPQDGSFDHLIINYTKSADGQFYRIDSLTGFYKNYATVEITQFNTWISSYEFQHGYQITAADFAGNDVFYGNSASDSIHGGAGNDTIFGGPSGDGAILRGDDGNDYLDGGIGTNALDGGNGADTYIVRTDDDYVSETGTDGAYDLVRATLSTYALGSRLEGLIFDGVGPFKGTGNLLDNFIQGGSANDTLEGAYGNDTLVGGDGNDTYVLYDLNDLIVEKPGQGTDTVATTLAAYTLTDVCENLSYIGTGDFIGTGNAGDNVIAGASGNDTLDGAGGVDTLAGGKGNDVYFVREEGERIVEHAGQGTDLVRTTLNSYSLEVECENLEFIGTGDFYGTGNEPREPSGRRRRKRHT